MTNKAHLTAIKRKKISAPCKYLKEQGLILGAVLDYGCGRGLDADLLGASKYDPYFFPEYTVLHGNHYDTIYSNFVLNVIPYKVLRDCVLSNIRCCLKEDGVAYITVRRDVKKLNGYTNKGTWQGLIELDLPVVYEKKNHFIIYKLTKNNKISAI